MKMRSVLLSVSLLLVCSSTEAKTDGCFNRISEAFLHDDNLVWRRAHLIDHQDPELFNHLHEDQWIAVKLNDKSLPTMMGKLRKFRVPGADFFAIEDSGGRWYPFRESDIQKMRTVDASVDAKLVRNRSRYGVPESAGGNIHLYRDVICAGKQTLLKDPRFSTLEQALTRNQHAVGAYFARRAGGCFMIIPTGTFVTKGSAHRDEAREAGKRDWLSEHGSNAWLGTLYMSYLHCISGLAYSGFSKRTLYAIAGADVAGNVWEEVRIPGLKNQKSLPMFRSRGNEVHTDFADFASGVGGAATYLLAVKALEHGVGKLSKLNCPK